MLEGGDAERAWTAVEDVAAALRPDAERAGRPPDPSLSDGSAGLALFYAYLAAVTGDEAWAECAHRLLEEAIDALADRPLPAALHGGFAGIGWTVEHLTGMLLEAEAGDGDDEIAEALAELLERPARRGGFDLITGLTGLGVYALEALPRPAARRCLERVVERLAEIGEAAVGGFSWFTPPELLPEHQRESAPRGNFNLGVAHGVPAVVSLLGACLAAGVLRRERRPLLDGAVGWLLAQKQEGVGWCFPSWVAEGVAPSPARLAWCYGDPGVAAALLTAARHARREAWEAEALEIARRAAARPAEHSGVLDAGLCHGAAGLGHLFNRIHQASGDEVLAEAARGWFRRALELRRPGEGVAGFLAWAGEDPAVPKWEATRGFLNGAAGVALALLAAVTPLEPSWDRSLAISVPLGPPPAARSGRG